MKLIALVWLSLIGMSLTEDAPFGLKWGLSVNQIRSSGIQLEISDTKGRFSIYTTSKLPKNPTIAERYMLIFDKEYKLQKIAMYSQTIENDLNGEKGKNKYQELKDLLTRKYGSPTSNNETVKKSLFSSSSNDFYKCLQTKDCGMWQTSFEAGNCVVILELAGKENEKGKGFIRLVYEGPEWGDSFDAFRTDEKEAL